MPFLILTLLLPACGKKESGRLVVYSAGPRPLAEFLCASYTEETGVPVELFCATTGQVMAKLEAEKYNARADVILVAGETPVLGLKQGGRLLAYAPEGLERTHGDWHDPDHFYHATAAAVVGIARREDREQNEIKTWRGALEEGGRIAMPSPSRSGTAGDFVLALHQREPAEFWEIFLKARQQGLEIVGANSQAITGLVMGAYSEVFAAADYIICREVERGERLVIVFPEEGCPFIFRPVAILASTRRPAEAKAFVDHCFSEAAQEQIAAQNLLPARTNVALSSVRRRFGIPVRMPFDAAAALDGQKDLLRRFQYEVERAVVVKTP